MQKSLVVQRKGRPERGMWRSLRRFSSIPNISLFSVIAVTLYRNSSYRGHDQSMMQCIHSLASLTIIYQGANPPPENPT